MENNKFVPPVPIDTNNRRSASDPRTAATSAAASMQELYDVAHDWAAEGIDLRIMAQLLICQLFERAHHMHGAIAEAYAGQPFNNNLAPDSPENQRRFRSYIDSHKAVSSFLFDLIDVTMAASDSRADSGSGSKKRK
jgi:hypothetical protein